MKSIKIIALLLTVVSILSSCESNPFCTEGEGPIVTEERFTPDFEGVELRGSAEVIIKQDSITRVVVQAQSSIHHQVTTTVLGGKLVIDIVGCISGSNDVIVYASSPSFDDIIINGSGEITSEGLIAQDNVDIWVDGSGEIELELDVEQLETRVTGSGDIRLEGNADEHEIEIDGSGDITSFGLETDTTDILIAGSGDCRVRVNDELNIDITGSGDVYFKGSPDVNANVTGSGNIIDAN